MIYKIDTDIPLPQRSPSGRKAKLDLGALDVGHSVFVPKSDLKSPHSAVRHQKRRKFPDRSFTVKIRSENGAEGARIWRTA